MKSQSCVSPKQRNTTEKICGFAQSQLPLPTVKLVALRQQWRNLKSFSKPLKRGIISYFPLYFQDSTQSLTHGWHSKNCLLVEWSIKVIKPALNFWKLDNLMLCVWVCGESKNWLSSILVQFQEIRDNGKKMDGRWQISILS